MTQPFPLDEMSTEKKLQMMEALWDDLSRNAGDLKPPDWHGEMLKQRAAAVEDGTESIEDWQQARERIEKETR